MLASRVPDAGQSLFVKQHLQTELADVKSTGTAWISTYSVQMSAACESGRDCLAPTLGLAASNESRLSYSENQPADQFATRYSHPLLTL
jgi:hypothetical protein